MELLRWDGTSGGGTGRASRTRWLGCPQSCLHLEARVLQGSWVEAYVRFSSWGKNISLKCKSSYFRLWPCCLLDVSLCWTRSESHLPVPQVLWSGITAAPAACTLPASWGCVWSLQVWQKCLTLVKKINVARKVRSIGLWKENSDVCQSILIGYKFNQRGRKCKDEFLLFCTVESVGLSQKLTVGSGEPDLSIEIFV